VKPETRGRKERKGEEGDSMLVRITSSAG